MTPLGFFRFALLAPLGMPLLTAPFGLDALSALLMLSIAFGGIPYVVFAAAMFVLLGKCGTSRRMFSLCLWAPIIFLPLLLGWTACLTFQGHRFHWADLLPFAVYDLLMGYFYVGLCAVAYFGLKRRGWVRELNGSNGKSI